LSISRNEIWDRSVMNKLH